MPHELDLSDEGLADDVIMGEGAPASDPTPAPTATTPSEPPVAAPETPAAPVEASPPAKPADAPVAPAVPVVPEAPVELPEKYQGKTPAQIVEMHEHAERALRQQQAEHQRYLAEQNQLWQQMATQQAQPPQSPLTQPWVPSTVEDLQQKAYDDPASAFEWAANNSPDHLPHVVAAISEVDPVQAQRLSLQYQQHMANETMTDVRTQQQALASERAGQQAFRAFEQQFPKWGDVRPELQQILQERGEVLQGLTDPNAIYGVLKDAHEMALGRSYPRLLAAQQHVEQQTAAATAAAAVETGTPGASPTPVDTSEEDEIADQILAASKSARSRGRAAVAS